MNMKRGVCIGVDTSCYTTSLAAVDEDGVLVAQQRRVLPVKQGECGLRQSDALYQHVLQLPELFRQLLSDLDKMGAYQVRCVCVSVAPRDAEGSYMPVFRAGHSFAKTIAACYAVPLYTTSHQMGHLLAATIASGIVYTTPFAAIHLSGGTCEMLRVDPDSFEAELLGATDDCSAGQLMDRTGVALGLAFPAGVHMEKLAQACSVQDPLQLHRIPASVRDLRVSFSGPTSALLRRIDAGDAPQLVAMQAYSVVARSLVKWMTHAYEHTGIEQMLLMGGVASSATLRRLVEERRKKQCRILRISYADSALASDNAVGVAICGARRLKLGGLT
jgi:N6-L-threonylcarbamoyladenine synthase